MTERFTAEEIIRSLAGGAHPNVGDVPKFTAKGWSFSSLVSGNIFFNIADAGATGDGSTDDTIAIQASIDAASAVGGGIVYGPPGVYAATQIILKSHVIIMGSGWGTIFKQISATALDFVVLENISTEQYGMRDCKIDGNKTGQTVANEGIFLDHSGVPVFETDDPMGFFFNLFIIGCKGHGIKADALARDILIDSVHIKDCDLHNFHLNGARNYIGNCGSQGSGQSGFRCSDDHSRYVNCRSFGNTDHGFLIDQSDQVFSVCLAQDNDNDGFRLSSVSRCLLDSCVADRNGVDAGDATAAGFHLIAAQNNIISGISSNSSGATQNYNLRFSGGASAGNKINLISSAPATAHQNGASDGNMVSLDKDIFQAGKYTSELGTLAVSSDDHFQFGKVDSPIAGNPAYRLATGSEAVPHATLHGYDGSQVRVFIDGDFGGQILTLGRGGGVDLDIVSVVIPAFSTLQRPLAGTAARIAFDSTTGSLIYDDGTVWVELGGAGSNVNSLTAQNGIVNVGTAPDPIIEVDGTVIRTSGAQVVADFLTFQDKMSIPSWNGAPPFSQAQGGLYFDTVLNRIFWSNGIAWTQVGTGDGGGTITAVNITAGAGIGDTKFTASGIHTQEIKITFGTLPITPVPPGPGNLVGTDYITVARGVGPVNSERSLISRTQLGLFENDEGWTNKLGTINRIFLTAGVGLSQTGDIDVAPAIGGPFIGTIFLDIFDGMTVLPASTIDALDHIAITDTSDGNATKIARVDQILLSKFNNDAGWGTGTLTGLVGGVGIDVAGTTVITVTLDLTEVPTSTSDADGDFFLVVDSIGTIQRKLTKANILLSGFNNDNGWTSNVGTVTDVTGGIGIVSSGGATPAISLDLFELSIVSPVSFLGTDHIAFMDASDGNNNKRILVSTIPLTSFNNDAGWTNNVGTVTAVTGGNGIDSSGGATPDIDLNIDSLGALASGLLGTDHIAVADATVTKKALISGIPLSIFLNDSGFASGTVTDVLGGIGVDSSGGATPSISLDLFELTIVAPVSLLGTDHIVFADASDGNASRKILVSTVPLSSFSNDAGWTTNVGTVTDVTGGNGIDSSGGATPDIDLNIDSLGALASGLLGTDHIAVADATVTKKALISGIPLSIFSNNLGWTSNTGDITGVNITAGDGLTGDQSTASGQHTQTIDVDSTVVRTTGNQTIGGIKTFSSEIRGSADVVAFFTSDKRKKKEIRPIFDALGKVGKLHGVTFAWNELAGPEKQDREFHKERRAGLIAQDVREVLPEAVFEDEDGMLKMQYEQIIPLLVESIKELTQRVQELELSHGSD